MLWLIDWLLTILLVAGTPIAVALLGLFCFYAMIKFLCKIESFSFQSLDIPGMFLMALCNCIWFSYWWVENYEIYNKNYPDGGYPLVPVVMATGIFAFAMVIGVGLRKLGIPGVIIGVVWLLIGIFGL
jgi:hypothetical protein